MDIKERMARQMHRVKVEAAIAAMKTPPPDYVFKEPQMPKPMSEQQKVRAFIEDRTYDDIPMDQSKIDPKRVTSMADVHRIVISEQPREFVIGPKEQLDHKAPNFRNIGQEAIDLRIPCHVSLLLCIAKHFSSEGLFVLSSAVPDSQSFKSFQLNFNS